MYDKGYKQHINKRSIYMRHIIIRSDPEGSNVNLTCQSSRAFEYCTWSHKDKECHFCFNSLDDSI